MPIVVEQWRTLQEIFAPLGPTLQHLTLRLPMSEPSDNDVQTTSHVDLNLITFHFSNLHYEEASLHLLRGPISRKIRKITPDATLTLSVT
ncbi:hypothetical protein QCA50_004046 [Cerrena zonata]|uniref:Uncharacterized protein n=1 Tax=Cerrena zonata TaxID=2478898 RepID=A0AAW0GG80_9APHY